MRLDRAWIELHIPHGGRMCLLDEVIDWDAQHIRCRSGTQRAADHPLLSRGRLGIACGIEYAAQAMAVHAALLGGAATELGVGAAGNGASPRAEAGFLASLRNVQLHVQRLDDIQSDLICEAALVAGNRDGALYEFTVSSQSRPLVSGRATVVFDAGKRLKK